MIQTVEPYERISAGDTVSIENTQSCILSIGLISDNGFHLEMQLMPRQVVGFSTGNDDIKIILHDGEPNDLLVIRPESAS